MSSCCRELEEDRVRCNAMTNRTCKGGRGRGHRQQRQQAKGVVGLVFRSGFVTPVRLDIEEAVLAIETS